MNARELFNKGKDILNDNEIENYSNEARWIFESVFNCGGDYLIFHGNDEIDSARTGEYLDRIKKRLSGMPVQYVIGEWDFYGETFCVGEGVLIPRPETEFLVEFAVNFLKNKDKPVVVDICSGSGCIGLSVARLIPDSKVYLIEKSDDALKYLLKNNDKFSLVNTEIIHGDIFEGFGSFGIPVPDLILSNPPYINSDEVSTLQTEVLKEPVMALDGGLDGLDFYRAIADKWLTDCRGAVAVECGEGQSEVIEKLFSVYCSETYSVNDFNGIQRVVIGRKD